MFLRMSNESLFDKFGRLMVRGKEETRPQRYTIPEDRNKKLVLKEGTTIKDLQQYVVRLTTSLKGPQYRVSGRAGKSFAPPTEYAQWATNTPLDALRRKNRKEKADIAIDIYHEIMNYGRQTIDEITKSLEGWDSNLLTIVINALIMDDFIMIYREQEGLETLELVEGKIRSRILETRQRLLMLEYEETRDNLYVFNMVLPPTDYLTKPLSEVKLKEKKKKVKIVEQEDEEDIPVIENHANRPTWVSTEDVKMVEDKESEEAIQAEFEEYESWKKEPLKKKSNINVDELNRKQDGV